MPRRIPERALCAIQSGAPRDDVTKDKVAIAGKRLLRALYLTSRKFIGC